MFRLIHLILNKFPIANPKGCQYASLKIIYFSIKILRKINERLLALSFWLIIHTQKFRHSKEGSNLGKSSQTTEKVNDKSAKLVSNFVNVFFLG